MGFAQSPEDVEVSTARFSPVKGKGGLASSVLDQGHLLGASVGTGYVYTQATAEFL